MGDKKIHSEAIKQEENSLASYTAVVCSGPKLAPAYESVILPTWVKNLRYGNDYFKLIDHDAYYSAYHQYIKKILANPRTLVCMAVLSDDKDIVLGFSVTRGTVLDFVYVNKPYRNIGIGRFLIPKDVDTFTHITRTGLTIWNNKCKHWKFNPFA